VVALRPNGAARPARCALAGLVRLERGASRSPAACSTARGSLRRAVAARGHGLPGAPAVPHLSALANVAFGLGRSPWRPPRRRAAEWLAAIDLADHAEARPAELSGGQAQKVALARALASDPELLLLDETLSALDPGAREEMQALLARHLAVFRGPCLLVTHDRGDAAALASRTLRLEGGRLATPQDY
jgi:ABC-type sulfate/molybdate transport systems ATPase subunit